MSYQKIKRKQRTPAVVDEKFIKLANDFLESDYYKQNFEFEDDFKFEILSTIRYDPNLYKKKLNSSEIKNAIKLFSRDSNINSQYNNSIESTNASLIEHLLNVVSDPVSNLLDKSLFMLLDYHVNRLNVSAKFFKLDIEEITTNDLLPKLTDCLTRSYNAIDLATRSLRIRLLLNRSGEVTIECYDTPERLFLFDGLVSESTPTWNAYIDTEPCPVSPFTSFKTTRRDHYTAARNRMLPMDSEMHVIPKNEVILFNPSNELLEGSITNIAVLRDTEDGEGIKWVTPILATGCLCGVVRQFLIDNKLIFEKENLKIDQLKKGEHVLLFNGLNGVIKAEIK
ncbi:catalytic activity protein [[Candida] boidinii]|nr:catalytic activity protein [[Candida] boidinii]